MFGCIDVPIVVWCSIGIRMRRSTFCAWASKAFACNTMSVGLHTLKLSPLGDRAVTKIVSSRLDLLQD